VRSDERQESPAEALDATGENGKKNGGKKKGKPSKKGERGEKKARAEAEAEQIWPPIKGTRGEGRPADLRARERALGQPDNPLSRVEGTGRPKSKKKREEKKSKRKIITMNRRR